MFNYSVYRLEHIDYGAVIYIERNEEGTHTSAWTAVQAGLKEQRLWKEEGIGRVRFLIDDQIMDAIMAEKWAEQEYQSLPKCSFCVKPINDQIFHNMFAKKQFCSERCANADYELVFECLKDEQECDFR